MMLQTRRSPSRVDVCDFNALLLREHDMNRATTKYYLTQSPPPMTYRDLRLAMTNRLPSNIVILPETFSSTDPTTTTLLPRRRKSSHRKTHRRSGVDVYRSLMRPDSRCSMLSERDVSNDEMVLLTNAFTIDVPSWMPSNRPFHIPHMPSIQKPRLINNSPTRISTGRTIAATNRSPSPFLAIKNLKSMQPVPPQDEHRTTPIDEQSQNIDDQLTSMTTITTTKILDEGARKQLHVYIPQLFSH